MFSNINLSTPRKVNEYIILGFRVIIIKFKKTNDKNGRLIIIFILVIKNLHLYNKT